MKSIIRKEKSTLENKKDFYQTNPYMVKSLVNWLKKNNFPAGSKVLDPCCGQGVISEGLKDFFFDVTAYDKYTGEASKDFLDETEHFDMIVCNPPYSDKYNFIKHSRKLAKHVFVLLPLNLSNYNMVTREYEDIPEFVGRLQMVPKMFLDETTDWKPGGNSQYCWYYWKQEHNTDFAKTWYDDLLVYKLEDDKK